MAINISEDIKLDREFTLAILTDSELPDDTVAIRISPSFVSYCKKVGEATNRPMHTVALKVIDTMVASLLTSTIPLTVEGENAQEQHDTR